jgi:uncharacterized protein involved in exopolysaccharide biosynthesis
MLDVPESSPSRGLWAAFRKPLKWALAAGALTALVTVFMPNYYRSEARLLPVDTKASSGTGQLAAAAAAFGMSVPGGMDSDANLVDILQSRWLQEQLLQTRFQYHVSAWRFGAKRLEAGTLYDYLDQKNMDRAVKKLEGLLGASRDLKTKVITINAETRSPELSQLVVKRAQALLGEFLQEKEQTRGNAKAAFAEERLKEARQERSSAEEAFRVFLETNRNYQVSPDPAIRLKGARLESELRLREQLVVNLAIAREQALLESKDDVPILNVLDAGNLPIEKSGPARSRLVFLAALVSGLLALAWQRRTWILAAFVDTAEDRGDVLS